MINVNFDKIQKFSKLKITNDVSNISKIINFIGFIENITPISKHVFRYPWINSIVLDHILKEEDIPDSIDKTANYKEYFIVPKVL